MVDFQKTFLSLLLYPSAKFWFAVTQPTLCYIAAEKTTKSKDNIIFELHKQTKPSISSTKATLFLKHKPN